MNVISHARTVVTWTYLLANNSAAVGASLTVTVNVFAISVFSVELTEIVYSPATDEESLYAAKSVPFCLIVSAVIVKLLALSPVAVTLIVWRAPVGLTAAVMCV